MSDQKIKGTAKCLTLLLALSIASGCSNTDRTKLDCSSNDPKCLFNNGKFYLEHDNKNKAKKYLEEACLLRYVPACYHVGLVHLREKNKQTAKSFFKSSCSYGNYDGCYEYANLLRNGDMEKQKARGLYLFSCNRGKAEACNQLASIQEDSSDFPSAKKYYKRACDRDYMQACYRMATIDQTNGNFTTAYDVYSKYCLRNHKEACDRIEELKKKIKDFSIDSNMYQIQDSGFILSIANSTASDIFLVVRLNVTNTGTKTTRIVFPKRIVLKNSNGEKYDVREFLSGYVSRKEIFNYWKEDSMIEPGELVQIALVFEVPNSSENYSMVIKGKKNSNQTIELPVVFNHE